MIKHIHAMCQTWGAQCAARDFGVNQGYPHRASVDKAREMRLSDRAPAWFRKKQFTAKGLQDFILRPTQFGEEGLTGDGLLVGRAMKGAPEDHRKLAYVHYVIMVTPSEGSVSEYKAEQLGVKHVAYWKAIDQLHWFILGRLPHSDEGRLTVQTPRPKFRPQSATLAVASPVANLAALNRSKVTLR